MGASALDASICMVAGGNGREDGIGHSWFLAHLTRLEFLPCMAAELFLREASDVLRLLRCASTLWISSTVLRSKQDGACTRICLVCVCVIVFAQMRIILDMLLLLSSVLR